MKKKITLLAFCGLFASVTTAQVNPSTAAETNIWGAIENTGVAIAPQMDWNAVVHDDNMGNYHIQWMDPASGGLIQHSAQPGFNPDVAYYADASLCAVGYENLGAVWIDVYQLGAGSPLYGLVGSFFIGTGSNANIDINSQGDGLITWENASGVMVMPFQMGSIGSAPALNIATGEHPDVAIYDNSDEFVITYRDAAGDLEIRTYEYWPLYSASLIVSSMPTTVNGNYTFPRVQSNRNAAYGGADRYTVVAQDNIGGGIFDVFGYFFAGSGILINTVHVNNGASLCGMNLPNPVIAYERDEVHIAFSSYWGCYSYSTTSPKRDVFMVQFDHGGIHSLSSTTPSLVTFQEVNNSTQDFTYSSNGLNTKYDGFFAINSANYSEGIAFNSPSELFWKVRDPATPFFRTSGADKFTVTIDKGVSENLITVEVATQDETVTEGDLEISFQLYDQSGRLVDVPAFEQESMTFTIDATSLEHGIYLLHYTLNGETKAERIPHFVN